MNTGSSAFASDSLGVGLEAFARPEFGVSPLRIALLCAVLVGLVAIAWWASRGSGGARLPRAGGFRVRVVQRVPVGRRQSLLLVEAEGRRILVGSTPNSLTAISEWDEEPESAEVTARAGRGGRANGTNGKTENRMVSTFENVLERLRSVEEPS